MTVFQFMFYLSFYVFCCLCYVETQYVAHPVALPFIRCLVKGLTERSVSEKRNECLKSCPLGAGEGSLHKFIELYRAFKNIKLQIQLLKLQENGSGIEYHLDSDINICSVRV